MNIRFGTIDDLEEIVRLEQQCFPAAEAADRDIMEQRLILFPKHFWILEENGRIISVLNGIATDVPTLQDEMYVNPTLHREEGMWQMIFGLATDPQYQGQGYGTQLLRHVIADVKSQGRKGIVLTCKDGLLAYYERVGFVSEGKSASRHGGAVWNSMRLTF